MKKFLLLSLACLMGGSAIAQDDYVTPFLYEEVFLEGVSRDGSLAAGQDVYGSLVYGLVPSTGEITIYDGMCIGGGNFIANNGMMVGQDIFYKGGSEQHAAVMFNGKKSVPDNLKNIGFSALNGISADGTRACGYMTASGKTSYVPFIVNIDADGTVSKAVKLPFPSKDFFGSAPQMVTAICISDDGKTVAGLLTDGSGFYMYPIVFKEGADGTWTYTEPTKPLFNTSGVTVPGDPEETVDPDEPKAPSIADYMTDEELEAYRKALATDPNVEPWDFMTAAEYAAYQKAVKEYNDAINEWLDKTLGNYHKNMYEAGKDEMFGPNMAISSDGSKLLVMQNHHDQGVSADAYTYSDLILIDTNTSELTKLNSGNHVSLVPLQILDDGTLTVWGHPTLEFIPYVTYMQRPDSNEFEEAVTFLEEKIPAYYPWLEDTLGMYGVIGYDPETGAEIRGDYIVSGIMTFSEDLSVVAGGLPLGEGISYIYYKEGGFDFMQSGVKDMVAAPENGLFNVYNLNGVKVMATEDASRINNLPKGIYIVNGKKVAL